MLRRWVVTECSWRYTTACLPCWPTATTPSHVHGDYQHFNLLRSREKLTGVVDWTFSTGRSRVLQREAPPL